ncbi:HNH endonuclease [Streptomyces viridochromogenes]|uniref:HNH endonuclease n=1 Tax=Streptomyces viridochromogenes TaxID=1938 RepID=UPI00069F312D|nr:HNH endonuclease [Streptomyces viridochromogenes]
MIPVQRLPATHAMTRLCDFRTEKIREAGAAGKAAHEQWKAAKSARRHIKGLLEQMAPGRIRCMYCLDSQGTDIDHFEPKARTPLRTFCWDNHLLACSHCNSNEKRDLFPCDPETGTCLLIDPTVDDPADHLKLLPRTGELKCRTRKGWQSIEVFGLNRDELRKGRADACEMFISGLIRWHDQVRLGKTEAAARTAVRLRRADFPEVLRTLEGLAGTPLASVLEDRHFPEALSTWVADRDHRGAIPVIRLSGPVPWTSR